MNSFTSSSSFSFSFSSVSTLICLILIMCPICTLTQSTDAQDSQFFTSTTSSSTQSSGGTNVFSLSALTSSHVSVIADISLQNHYLMSKLIYAYELVVPDMKVVTVHNDDTITNQHVIDNQSDFGVTGIVPDQTATHHQNRDDLLLLPAFASGVVVTYRVNSLHYDNSIPIVLSRSVLAMIFEGNITIWSDPAIRDLNPALNLPQLNITVILPSNQQALTYAFTTAINKFSSTKQIIPSPAPTWPISRYSHYLVTNVSLDASVSIDGSISYAPISTATHYGLRYASLINKAGHTVEATPASINYALIELGSLQSSNTKLYENMAEYDITDAAGPNAYPIVSMSYIMLSNTVKRDSCSVRAGMVKFWLWFYQSSSVTAIMRALQVSLMPDVVMTERKIIDILSNQISCDGHILTVNTARTNVDVHGEPWLGVFTDVLLGFYQQHDSGHEFRFHPSNTWSAYNQIDHSEVDAALVLDSFLTPEQYADPELVMVPAWLSAVGPIFHFDDRVTMTTLHENQLILDLDTLYRIFMGDIDDWLHPAITANNPDLAQRFGRNESNMVSSISTSITVVVTRTKTRAVSEPVGDTFAQGLRRWDIKIPFDWSYIASKFPKRFIVAESPDQVASVVKTTPGAIGYRLIDVGVVEPNLHVSMVSTDSQGTKRIIKGDNEALVACLKGAYDIDPTLVSTPVSNVTHPQCWPFTALLSFIVRQRYYSKSGVDVCTRANATLSLLRFFLTNQQLKMPLDAQGVVSVDAVPQLKRTLLEKLNSITCDGENLLITYPLQWSISRGIQIFGYVFSTIGIVYCIALIVFVVYHRRHGVIRSASMTFLLVTLCGVILLFISGMFLVAQATYTSCGGFVWTASLGFMLTFAPLFAKTWRIYRIFGRKALKVVKISNQRLGVMIGSLVTVSTIMLIVWQARSPMAPYITTKMEGQRIREYSQCSISSEGTPFLVILLSIKAALLVFGAIMALSTRRVASAYNECQSVAWSIYNTAFSICIVVPISIFTSSIGDSLILLMSFLLLWISFFTVSAMFIPKVISLMRVDTTGLYSMSESGEYREVSNGFSFLSPRMLSKQILQKYVVALELQLKEAKARLAALGSKLSTDAAVTAGDTNGGRSYHRYDSADNTSHAPLKSGTGASHRPVSSRTTSVVSADATGCAAATTGLSRSTSPSTSCSTNITASSGTDRTHIGDKQTGPTSTTTLPPTYTSTRPKSYSNPCGARSFSPSSRSAIEPRYIHVNKQTETQLHRRVSAGDVAMTISNAISSGGITSGKSATSAPAIVPFSSTASSTPPELSNSRPAVINGFHTSTTHIQQSTTTNMHVSPSKQQQ